MMTKTTTETRPRNPEKMTTSREIFPTTIPSKQTKKAQLIRLLSKAAGAEITSISKKFGWQRHTTRAALSSLRKSGYEIFSTKPGTGKPAKYRITSAPAERGAQ